MTNKTRIYRAILAAIITTIVYGFICWMGGYNFDHRNLDTGFATFIGVVCVVFVANITFNGFGDL